MTDIGRRLYRSQELVKNMLRERPEEEKPPGPGMRVSVAIIPAATLVLGGVFVVVSLVDLDLKNPSGGPGPGFFPLVCGIILVVVSGVLLLRELLPSRRRDAPADTHQNRIFNAERLVRVGVTVVVATALLGVIGAVPSFILMILWIVKVIEGRSWLMAVTTSVLLTAFVFLLFEVTLDIPLPGRLSDVIGL